MHPVLIFSLSPRRWSIVELPSKGTRALVLGFESEGWGREFLKVSAAERQAPCSVCGSGVTRSESTREKKALLQAEDIDISIAEALFFSFFLFRTHLYFPAFGLSRGHRSRPFPPPTRFLPSTFYRAYRVQQSYTACRFFIECVANSRSRAFRCKVNLCTRKSPHEFIRVHALGGDSKHSRN